jgi:hypothetical protein
LYTLGLWWWVIRPAHPQQAIRKLASYGLAFGAGVGLPWLVLWLYSGTTVFEIFQTGITNHRELVRRADYFTWVFLHLYDLFLFTGWALVGLAGWGIWRAVRALQQGEFSPLNILGGALATTLILVAISGTAQGETARLLSFYLPFLILMIPSLQTQNRIYRVGVWGLQLLTVLVMASLLLVIPQDLNDPPTAPRQDVPSYDHLAMIPVEGDFRSQNYIGEFTLAGYRFIADPANQVITLEFDWRGQAPTERPYQFEAIARAENPTDGQIISDPWRWYPQSGNYLTTCWQANDHIRDVIILPLPPVSEPVRWTVELRAIDTRTTDSLPSEPLLLGPINYP